MIDPMFPRQLGSCRRKEDWPPHQVRQGGRRHRRGGPRDCARRPGRRGEGRFRCQTAKRVCARGAMRARVLSEDLALQTKGAGNAGCPMHPQPRARWWAVSMRTSIHSRGTGKSPGIPHAMVGLLIRDLPGAEFLWPPSRRGLHGISHPGWAECASARASTTDARTTRLHRTQQCRAPCTPLSIAHELLRPATSCAHDIVAPPHPAPLS